MGIHYYLQERKRELLGFIQADPVLYPIISRIREHHFPSYQHSLRVALVAEDLAERLGFDKDDSTKLRIGALLHDVGKVIVPQEILNAKVKPSGTDWEIMKGHIVCTREIILGSGIEDKDIMYIALAHHEFQRESYSRQGKTWLGLERRAVTAKVKSLAQLLVMSDKLDASLYRKDGTNYLSTEDKIRRDFTGDQTLVSEIMKYAS